MKRLNSNTNRFKRGRSEDPDDVLSERRRDMMDSQQWKDTIMSSSKSSFIRERTCSPSFASPSYRKDTEVRSKSSQPSDSRKTSISVKSINSNDKIVTRPSKPSNVLFPQETQHLTIINPPEEFQNISKTNNNNNNTQTIPSISNSSMHSESMGLFSSNNSSNQPSQTNLEIIERGKKSKSNSKSSSHESSLMTTSSSTIHSPMVKPSVLLNDVPESLPLNHLEKRLLTEPRKMEKNELDSVYKLEVPKNNYRFRKSRSLMQDDLSFIEIQRENHEEETEDSSCDEKEKYSRVKRISNLLKEVFSFLFSHIGLLIMVIGYTLLGGYLFYSIEKQTEVEIKTRMRNFQQDVLKNFSLIWRNYQLELLKNLSLTYGLNPDKMHLKETKENDDKEKLNAHKLPSSMAWYLAGSGRPSHLPPVNLNETKLPNPRLFWDWSLMHAPTLNTNSTNSNGCFTFPLDDFDNKTFAEKLGNYSDKFNTSYVENFPSNLIITAPSENVVQVIYHYSDIITSNFTDILNNYLTVVASTIGQDGWNGSYKEEEEIWTFSAGILFAMTIITTIGYGHVTPKTKTGQFFTMIYAAFGIPMFFSYLATNGDYMAHLFRLLYAKICRPAWRRVFKKKPKKLIVPKKIANPKDLKSIICCQKSGNNEEEKNEKSDAATSAENNNDAKSPPFSPVNKYDKPDFDEDENVSVKSSRSGKQKRGNSSSPQGSSKQTKLKFDLQSNGNQVDNNENQGRNESYEEIKTVTVPISLTFCIMAIYIIIGAIIFGHMESEANILKWSYFCFVTLSTIGFGDIIPGMALNDKQAKQKFAFVTCYLTIGLILFAMCFKLMEEEALAKLKKFGRKIGIVNDKSRPRRKRREKNNPVTNA